MAGLRIGIDVGGTFTHGVVLRPPGEVLHTARTPTTHTADRGVAEGVRTVLVELVGQVDPAEIELVAHSTTQATNALLEGDVSPVIQHVIIPPGEGLLCRRALAAKQLEIGNGHQLRLQTIFIDHASAQAWEPSADFAGESDRLPVAVIQPLAGDADNLEAQVAETWRAAGHDVVCASEITRVLGLKARARTACVNASMLPAMIATAEFTAEAVDEVLPGVPVQVVRSDGGAMSLDEMRRMPVLSLLSGPAAGASAALHRTGLSEVIFIEVGGTSTDITLIREGKVRHRYATVGGQRLMVPALDLRTVAVGGGSMLRADGSCFGPRSAHKAGLPYLFQAVQDDKQVVDQVLWKDPTSDIEYIAAKMSDDSFAAVTLTDFWFAWGIFPTYERQNGNSRLLVEKQMGIEFSEKEKSEVLNGIFEDYWGVREKVDHFVERWGYTAAEGVCKLIHSTCYDLLSSHNAEGTPFSLIAGGGGALPVLDISTSWFDQNSFKTDKNLNYKSVVDHHAVISAIGAALAVTCVSQSKSVADPTSGDIAELVSLVETRLQQQGAERVSTEFEFDPHRQVLTVTGRGNRPYDQESELLDDDGLWHKAREQLGDTARQVWHDHQTSLWLAGWVGTQSQNIRQHHTVKDVGVDEGESGSMAPRLPEHRQKAEGKRQAEAGGSRGSSRRAQRGKQQALALHRSGRSLWCGTLTEWSAAVSGELEAELSRIIEQRTQYTDGGPALPGLALLADGRLIPLDSLGSRELIDDILRWENLPPNPAGCFLLRD